MINTFFAHEITTHKGMGCYKNVEKLNHAESYLSCIFFRSYEISILSHKEGVSEGIASTVEQELTE